jgi:ATP-dependent Clp protease adaptor protein ClpS
MMTAAAGRHDVRGMADRRMAGRDGKGGPGDGDADRNTSVITRTKPKTKKPSLYRVLLLNDDYTPMEFVIHVLERFFQKDREAATRIMLHVHNHGVGECGTFTYEVAETKVTQVMDFARQHQHPLQCVMEKN